MSYELGVNIKKIREDKKATQEDVAKALNTSRQRYARMEDGTSEISYKDLCAVANFLGVALQEITSIMEEKKSLSVMFREKGGSEKNFEAVEKIEEILRVFYSHEKLYRRMRDKGVSK